MKIMSQATEQAVVLDNGAAMKVSGSCHCKQVCFTAQIDPDRVIVCHCTDCQKLSGSAFRVVVPAVNDQFVLTGDVAIYTKTAESGRERAQAFCPNCGTQLYSGGQNGTPYMVRVGVLDRASELSPRAQLWQQSQWAWTNQLPSLLGCQKQELL